MISSRGITYRHRHLIQDLLALLPHARKGQNLILKNLHQLNEVAELYNCNNIFFLNVENIKIYIYGFQNHQMDQL